MLRETADRDPLRRRLLMRARARSIAGLAHELPYVAYIHFAPSFRPAPPAAACVIGAESSIDKCAMAQAWTEPAMQVPGPHQAERAVAFLMAA